MEDERISVAKSLALRDKLMDANRDKWQQVYRRRYQKDERYASHEHVAFAAWLYFHLDENTIAAITSKHRWTTQLGVAYEEWLRLDMPSWWVAPGVVELVRDTKSESTPLDGSELPDDAGLVMLPKGMVTLLDIQEGKEVEIIGVLFVRHNEPFKDSVKSDPEKEALLLTFLTEVGNPYQWACVFGEYLADDWDIENPDQVKDIQALARLVVSLLQVIRAVMPLTKESVELTPSKIKHHQVKPALWSRRMVGEGFRYSRKLHQGGKHMPPRLHRRKAHTKGFWVGHSEERHLEERRIAATWVADGSLSVEEKQQLIGLLGNRFRVMADSGTKEMGWQEDPGA
jgi:hypothetical protein